MLLWISRTVRKKDANPLRSNVDARKGGGGGSNTGAARVRENEREWENDRKRQLSRSRKAHLPSSKDQRRACPPPSLPLWMTPVW